MFVLPIPDIDGGAAFAGAIPIQTTPAITAVLNTRVRIDFASLTKVTVLCSFQRLSPEGPQCDRRPVVPKRTDLLHQSFVRLEIETGLTSRSCSMAIRNKVKGLGMPWEDQYGYAQAVRSMTRSTCPAN